jgi:hypothetical protein
VGQPEPRQQAARRQRQLGREQTLAGLLQLHTPARDLLDEPACEGRGELGGIPVTARAAVCGGIRLSSASAKAHSSRNRSPNWSPRNLAAPHRLQKSDRGSVAGVRNEVTCLIQLS